MRVSSISIATRNQVVREVRVICLMAAMSCAPLDHATHEERVAGGPARGQELLEPGPSGSAGARAWRGTPPPCRPRAPAPPSDPVRAQARRRWAAAATRAGRASGVFGCRRGAPAIGGRRAGRARSAGGDLTCGGARRYRSIGRRPERPGGSAPKSFLTAVFHQLEPSSSRYFRVPRRPLPQRPRGGAPRKEAVVPIRCSWLMTAPRCARSFG